MKFIQLILLLLLFLSVNKINGSNKGGPNNQVYQLDNAELEKNLEAALQKVSHGFATTKRSVPAFEAQISASTTLSTVPSPLTTTITSVISTSTIGGRNIASGGGELGGVGSRLITTTTTLPSVPSYKYIQPRATISPVFRELPSYSPPSRTPFTPPLPPDYSNPFADKPTLRGTNYEPHSGVRRPIPPPSLTPAHERIPIRPPDLIHPVGQSEKTLTRNKAINTPSVDDDYDRRNGFADANVNSNSNNNNNNNNNNSNNDFLPTLHSSSISRILSGSNGRKQDIPEILLKPLSTKMPLTIVPVVSTTQRLLVTSTTVKTTTGVTRAVTNPTIFNLPNTRRQGEEQLHKNHHHNRYNSNVGDDDDEDDEDDVDDDDSDNVYRSGSSRDRNKNNNNNNDGLKREEIEIVDAERLPYPQPQPPAPSKRPIENEDSRIPQMDTHPLQSTWNIAWFLHVYVAAIMFTLMALYSIYKIVRFNEATNLLSQSYFFTIHLLLTAVCTLRSFHLFYDPYNLTRTLSEPLSQVLMYLPAPLLSTSFATLVIYLAKCSEVPTLNNKFLSPMVLTFFSAIHIILCLSLNVSSHVLSYDGGIKIFPLICQCVYIVICVTIGLCYMYVYRVIRSHINLTNNKTINSHVGNDPVIITLRTAITNTIATALLFILMGFIQLYGIFGIRDREPPYPWLWWGWEFSVRLIELSICGLLAWVASLSQYPLREKQLQQNSTHSAFALFPCGSSTSTENMDDSLYPAICSTNQAIQNYTMRTGKQVYDDSFPLNALPEHLNISGTFERHSIRKSGTMGPFPHDGRGSLNRHGNGVQTLRNNSESRNRHTHTPVDQQQLQQQQQQQLQQTVGLHEQVPTSGSTMLVAEDGFVRFRSLGAEEDDLSDTQSIAGTHGIIVGGSVRYSTRQHHNNSSSSTQQQQQHQHNHHQYQHQHSLQHPHPNHQSTLHQTHHQSHHQLYNNT